MMRTGLGRGCKCCCKEKKLDKSRYCSMCLPGLFGAGPRLHVSIFPPMRCHVLASLMLYSSHSPPALPPAMTVPVVDVTSSPTSLSYVDVQGIDRLTYDMVH